MESGGASYLFEDRRKRVLYEFNLTCGHLEWVEVDDSFTPINPDTRRPDITTYRTNFGETRTVVTYTCPACRANGIDTRETP